MYKRQDGHRIVEIGCIELDDLIPTKKTFHCYLNPERKVSEKALEVHGYTDEFLSSKKKFKEMYDKWISGYDVVYGVRKSRKSKCVYELRRVPKSN